MEDMMNKKKIVKKYKELLKKHKISKEETIFEIENISRWFDSCKKATFDDLKAKERYLKSLLIGCSSFDADKAYFECRSVYQEIVHHFLAATC
jgi:hypothetical protein